MFTRLDDILYPGKVEVVHFTDMDKYIYPIYKNGSSAIARVSEEKKYRTLVNDQIRRLTDIDVFVRNGKERYQSGFQTYIHNNFELDYQTMFNLGQRGYVLDRHYLPQINWLINLMRYMDPNARIHIHDIGMLDEYAPGKDTPPKSKLEVPMNDWIEMALRLDHILWADMSGQSWTPREIMAKLAEDDTMAYGTVFGKGKALANVLP